MDRGKFLEVMSLFKGAFGDKVTELYQQTLWEMFSKVPDAVFVAACNGIMQKSEFLPKPATIFKATEEERKKRSGGCPREKIGEIQSVAQALGIPMGEALQMIYCTFGWMWKRIPVSRVDEVKEFLVNNKHRRMEIIVNAQVSSQSREVTEVERLMIEHERSVAPGGVAA